MTDRNDQWLGRSLMALRRLEFEGPTGTTVSGDGAIELLWDDRSVMLIDTKTDWTLTVSDVEWEDPYGPEPYPEATLQTVTELGRWVKRDVSRTPEFGGFIGQTLASISWQWYEVGDARGVILDFGRGRISAHVGDGGEVHVETELPTPSTSYLHVAWVPAKREDPCDLYCEIVDGLERRKVEVWSGGRRGWASAFVEHGGSIHTTTGFPTVDDINADPQFQGEVINAERFDAEWQAALSDVHTTTLWRPTGPRELELIRESGCRRWPPRLPDQPVFYPVTSRAYAERIARQWNVPDGGVGYITRFEVVTGLMTRYRVHEAGGSELTEWWIPAEDLEDLNDHIVGPIELVTEVRG